MITSNFKVYLAALTSARKQDGADKSQYNFERLALYM